METMKRLKGVLLKEADKPNINGITYSKEALESIHKQIQENKGRFLGELGQSEASATTVHMKNAALAVEDSQFDGKELSVDLVFFDDSKLSLPDLTPALRTAASVRDSVVQKDVKLIAVDLVRKDEV